MSWADPGGSGSCFSGQLGAVIDCGGGYVVPGAPTPTNKSHSALGPAPKPPPMMFYVAAGPNGPCMALGPANPAPNATILAWLATVHYPPCNTPRPAPINPVAFAVNFWRTIPLPTPRPAIPPGYAITGKPAYLVTHGTTTPAPFVENTPLGQLTVRAVGTYVVDWGDGSSPTWTGPYSAEGEPWPNGNIAHTYDNVGSYTVVAREDWTATWSLAGATGALIGLRTQATIANFPVQQVQAVITN